MFSQSACWVLGMNPSQIFSGLTHANSTSKGTTTTKKNNKNGEWNL